NAGFDSALPSEEIWSGFFSCHGCSNQHGLILKFGLNTCCQRFCQYAKDIGFIKLD
uniref:40S ribosomal protein S29 n=2 Tax=Ursus TaxID=9639 RepID=A0A452VJ32_URSMA